MDDYRSTFDPGFRIDLLSRSALAVLAREYQLAAHLQDRAGIPQVLARHGAEAMREIAIAEWMREIAALQFVGSAGLAAERVAAAMQIRSGESEAAEVEAIAKLFQLHPAFHPRAYVDLHVERDDHAVHCWIGDSAAFAEGDTHSWFALVAESSEPHPALDAIVRTVNPRARCRPTSLSGARVAWRVEIDPNAEPAPEPAAVSLAKLSKGASFRFAPRGPAGR